MKRAIILTLTALTLASCKPQKPWSPYDKDGGAATPAPDSAVSSSPEDQIVANIGDVEQALYVDGQISAESAGPNVKIEDTRDHNKHLIKSSVVLTPPLPESLWAEFDVKCNRNFKSAPAVLRARIMVDDKVAGSVSTVLGALASKTKLAVKFDLLKPFHGNLPDTFLAKVDGDLYLMPEGTDENKVNPETATSDFHSKALYATMIRVTIEKPGSSPAAAAEAPTNAAVSAGPSPEPAAPATEPTAPVGSAASPPAR